MRILAINGPSPLLRPSFASHSFPPWRLSLSLSQSSLALIFLPPSSPFFPTPPPPPSSPSFHHRSVSFHAESKHLNVEREVRFKTSEWRGMKWGEVKRKLGPRFTVKKVTLCSFGFFFSSLMICYALISSSVHSFPLPSSLAPHQCSLTPPSPFYLPPPLFFSVPHFLMTKGRDPDAEWTASHLLR